MRLDDYCALFERSQFPTMGVQEHPERASVLEARHALAAAVVQDAFLADCIRLELDRIEQDRPQTGLVPFHTIESLGIRFAFGYWPPGATAGPHEHTAWTITAVCRNELEVFTFDRDASYRSGTLVSKNRFEAKAGLTGFIYEPCLHEPRNPTRDWSLSMHVLSPRDGEKLTDYEQCIPMLVEHEAAVPVQDPGHPYTRVMAVRRRHRFAQMLARTLIGMDVPDAPGLLARCFALGASATRRMIARTVPAAVPVLPRGPWLLERTHPDLVLAHRIAGDVVALDVLTPGGTVQELTINPAARAALAFVARESMFDIRALPGGLSEEERMAIAETLEDTGLFRRATL